MSCLFFWLHRETLCTLPTLSSPWYPPPPARHARRRSAAVYAHFSKGAHGRRRWRRRRPATTPPGPGGSREVQMDAQAVVVLPRNLFCRNLAGRVSRHVSSGAGAAPDVLVVYHPSRWPNRRDPHTGGKRAVGEGVQTCWPEVRRGCCGLHVVGGGGRGFEQITQGEEFPREKTDAGGITHSSPHSTAYAAGVNAVIGAARGQGCVGATLRARAPRAHMRATSTCASRGSSLQLVGKSAACGSKCLPIMHAPHGGAFSRLLPPLLPALRDANVYKPVPRTMCVVSGPMERGKAYTHRR